MFDKIEISMETVLGNIWKKYKMLVIFSFISGPFLTQVFLKCLNEISKLFNLGVLFAFPSDWLGFWGSYLGIIPSGLIAYYIAKYQIDIEKRREKLENDQKNLPYLTIDLDRPFVHYKQDNVYNYIVEYFIKFSSYNAFYPVRSVTVFLYMKSADDKNYVLKDSVILEDIMPCVDNFTNVRFEFDNENNNLYNERLIFYGRLIDGRVVKIETDNDTSSHLYMTNDKVWYSYEPTPLEDSFDELERAEIYKQD